MSELKIYKASAGSGKTYKLTEEYLRLLFKNPGNYKRTLAVTFTNKATEEMKTRIIAELYKLSQGNENDYYKTFTNEFGFNKEKIKQQSSLILSRILHDYSKFSVGTIDSFFQKVIRAFSKEIGLYSGYSIELDNSKILSEATDNFFDKIDSDVNTKNWLLEFAEEKITDGRSWNLKNDIQKLSFEIFKEEFLSFSKEIFDKINDKKFLKNYNDKLKEVKEEIEKKLNSISTEAIENMELYSLTLEDFPYGKTSLISYFFKLLNGNIVAPGVRSLDAIDNIDKWYTKTSTNKEAIIAAFNGGLNEFLKNAVECYYANQKEYNSVDKILSLFYSLGIITDIAQEVVKIRQDKNIFLLSDAAKFLKSIINDDDTPFVYEKMGYFFKHFMIDEFQDTSNMQWTDFKPLILNSLSEGNTSLIVGDVKQSIYRWRNSDWKLLAEQVKKDFQNQGTDENTLGDNWRSKKNVIYYNNSIFQKAASLLQNQFNLIVEKNEDTELDHLKKRIENAYNGLMQSCPAKANNDGGIVKNYFLASETFQDDVLNILPQTVEQIQDKGIQAKDIAILVRKHQDGKLVADTFLAYKNSEKAKKQYNYNIISNESLYIKSSKITGFLISLLKYFVQPDDEINKAYILSTHLLLNNNINYNDAFLDKLPNSFLENLPAEFSHNLVKLKKTPLYELVIQLTDIFELNKYPKELPYLMAFLDIVQQYSHNSSSDLNNFLDWWNDEGIKQTINTPDNTNAIRIITIHKSKGLEFDAVIVPFCNWELDPSKPPKIIWCKPEKEPFNQIELLPVLYTSALQETIFYKDYYNEVINNYIDNLNLLYVAFTRAKNALISFSPIKDEANENNSIKNISDLLLNIVQNQNPDHSDKEFDLNKFWNAENNSLIIDENIINKEKQTEKGEENALMTDFDIENYKDRLKLRFSNKNFFNENDTIKQRTNKGSILHRIFENIKSYNDVDKAIKTALYDGIITAGDVKEYSAIINNALNNSQAKNWFSGQYDIAAEMSIIMPDEKQKRPDRVMIKGNDVIIVDYKFGQEEHQKYISQVLEYHKILEQMGYNAQSYIWYVLLNKVVEVKK